MAALWRRFHPRAPHRRVERVIVNVTMIVGGSGVSRWSARPGAQRWPAHFRVRSSLRLLLQKRLRRPISSRKVAVSVISVVCLISGVVHSARGGRHIVNHVIGGHIGWRRFHRIRQRSALRRYSGKLHRFFRALFTAVVC
jgi:hypothetical protein